MEFVREVCTRKCRSNVGENAARIVLLDPRRVVLLKGAHNSCESIVAPRLGLFSGSKIKYFGKVLQKPAEPVQKRVHALD
jgi:hypothetical protein